MSHLDNPACTISNLPLDALTEIFIELSTLQTIALQRNLWRHGETFWVNAVRQVCRRWNAAILNSASIWSYIKLSCYSNLLVSVYLQRSEEAKLSIDMGSDRCMPDEEIYSRRLDLLTSHLHRIGELKINGHSSWMTSAVAEFLVKSLSSGSLSGLKSLSLISLSLPWNLPIFQNLSSLALVETEGLQPDELLNILKSSSNLKRLTLHTSESAWMKFKFDASEQNTAVRLTALEFLSLSMPLTSCIRFFEHVIVPADVNWYLGLAERYSFDPLIQDPFGPIARALPSMKGPHSVMIDTRSVQLCLSADATRTCNHSIQLDIAAYVVDWDNKRIGSLGSIQTIFETFFSEAVMVELIMDLQSQPSDLSSWEGLFYALPHVEILKIHIEAKGYRVLEQFFPRALGGQLRTPLSKLKQLHLGGFDFSHEDGSFAAILKEELVGRHEEGYVLEELHLLNSIDLSEEDLALLREIVPRVIDARE